jgi:hypothetical protein
MNYGPAYTSEIYHFLGASQILEKNFQTDIKVLSLGCGFGPDYIALNKYIFDKSLNFNVRYVGLDQESGWLRINEGVIKNLPNIKDVLIDFSLVDYDVIFLNKLFSTLLKKQAEQQFITLFVDKIKTQMKVGAIIIFNDINHYKMGRDIFDANVSSVAKIEGKFFFNVQSAYCNNYFEIPKTDNICQLPDDLPVYPKNSATKSIFFVYKK